MKKSKIPAIIIIAVMMFAIFVITHSRERDWTEIPGAGGIQYDNLTLKRDGGIVYADLKNENPDTKHLLKADKILFSAAFYCGRGKVRTLSQSVFYKDGTMEGSNENHLENNPSTDPLNESHDLRDISESPQLENAYRALCKYKDN